VQLPDRGAVLYLLVYVTVTNLILARLLSGVAVVAATLGFGIAAMWITAGLPRLRTVARAIRVQRSHPGQPSQPDYVTLEPLHPPNHSESLGKSSRSEGQFNG
jgi:hypothetical protein